MRTEAVGKHATESECKHAASIIEIICLFVHVYTVNREIFAALKVGEFAFFSISSRQNSAFAAEI
jgi:hypothetical protein